jgi:hypothetical protein
MASDKPYRWYHGAGSTPDAYTGGDFATREEAVADGQAYYEGDVFSIVEAQKGAFSVPTASDLMAYWLECWDDDDMGGEDACEWRGKPDQVKAAEADLQALLDGWVERHGAIIPEPWCFNDTRNEETFNEEADS